MALITERSRPGAAGKPGRLSGGLSDLGRARRVAIEQYVKRITQRVSKRMLVWLDRPFRRGQHVFASLAANSLLQFGVRLFFPLN